MTTINKVIEDSKSDFDKLGKFLESIQEPIIDLINKIEDNIENLELPYSDVAEYLKKVNTKGLKAKEKKELQKKIKEEALKHLEKNYPNILKSFNNADLIIIGIKEKLQELSDELNDFESEIDEIESLQSDLQDRKDNLDF